jgi:biopolymer transport protein ExbB
MRTKRTNTTRHLAVALLAFTAFSCTARAWWNSEWTLRKKITLDATPAGGGIADPIGTTPVLVRLHDGNFQFVNAKDDGSDIRFVAADDKTPLVFHVEKYDPVLNEAFVWVKVPSVKPGEKTSLWLYYGNSGGKAVKSDDPKGTYDSDTALVYHFGEHGSPASDATGSGNNAQNAGIGSDGSMIGSGLRFDGVKGVVIPATPPLALADGATLTWSAWIKPSTLQPNEAIYSRKDGANALTIGVDKGIPFVEVTSANGIQRSPADAPVAVNSWHHLAVVADGPKLVLYLDGESYATLAVPLPALNSAATLGGIAAVGSTDPAAVTGGFNGEMDELEISKIARPAGFIKLAAIGQSGDKAAKLLVFDPDEQPSSLMSWFKGGYFGIIISSLTFDGWAVIIILMLMMVLSWYVMITKVRYMNEMGKGNALFLREWKHVATDLTILDDADSEKSKSLGGRIDKKTWKTMRNSSVYRIYHTGVEEIQHRLTADRALEKRKGLSGRSIQAIRASLDGTLVRETQKINKLIVLLTICISGGPFLGLLGTVVGVMITFAAVAAAGDVNVNAIAPGIAAALLATVAGLAVAIPALFGYNYILSLVKDAKDDMHIFIDEFVTKMAEFYKE